ncbi:MAG: hypothetical protein IRY99_03085 [Isosphaeraceae bacterium]|nr:hypothetical protein [Isosphaeraceae bacterium]
MSLRISWYEEDRQTLGVAIERLADGYYLDASDNTFKPFSQISSPNLYTPLPEATSPRFKGSSQSLYYLTLTNTPANQFTDGDYAVTIHNLTTNEPQGILPVTMHAGDDATVFPTAGTGGDPWATALPGGYAPGTAGNILGTYLDAKVSSRSTYAGGPVASVVAPVTVGANNDKTGYSLAPSGLDAITIETGVNARQALTAILATSAGTIKGAGTGTITIQGGNTSDTRIQATTDSAGNRSSVTLLLPP